MLFTSKARLGTKGSTFLKVCLLIICFKITQGSWVSTQILGSQPWPLKSESLRVRPGNFTKLPGIPRHTKSWRSSTAGKGNISNFFLKEFYKHFFHLFLKTYHQGVIPILQKMKCRLRRLSNLPKDIELVKPELEPRSIQHQNSSFSHFIII